MIIGELEHHCVMLPFSYQVKRINIGGVISIFCEITLLTRPPAMAG